MQPLGDVKREKEQLRAFLEGAAVTLPMVMCGEKLKGREGWRWLWGVGSQVGGTDHPTSWV